MNGSMLPAAYAGRLAAAPLLVALLIGCATGPSFRATPPEKSPAPPALDPAAVALGAQVYAANCASCHGAELEGEANWKEQNPDGSFRSPPHDASGHTWHHADNVLLEAIREGGARFDGEDIGGDSPMPAFGGQLSEAEMTAVLAFIKSTWPADIRALQWEQTVHGAVAPPAN